MPSILAFRLGANAILLGMAFESLWQRKLLIVCMYLARSALANSPYPVRAPAVLALLPLGRERED